MRYLHYTNYRSGHAGLSNGIMSVEAKDMGTGRSQQVNVTPTSGLQPAEIDLTPGTPARALARHRDPVVQKTLDLGCLHSLEDLQLPRQIGPDHHAATQDDGHVLAGVPNIAQQVNR